MKDFFVSLKKIQCTSINVNVECYLKQIRVLTCSEKKDKTDGISQLDLKSGSIDWINNQTVWNESKANCFISFNTFNKQLEL